MQLRHITFSLIVLFLTACSSSPDKPYSDTASADQSADTDPKALYERTAALFSRPENIGLDFYSPTYYQSAITALQDAENALNDPLNNQVPPISASIAARKLLEKAQNVRTLVDRNLRNLVKHRNLLVELEASKWRKDEWNDVRNEIKDLVILVENEKIKRAISQEPGVREDMYTLEVNTLLASSLDLARTTLKKAEKAEADVYSPYYFNSADILIDDTEIYIRRNYRDRKGIEQRANIAYLEALRAYKTATDTLHISKLNNEDLERYTIALKKTLDEALNVYDSELPAPGTINEKLAIIIELANNSTQAPLAPTHQEAAITEHEDNQSIEVLQVLDSLYLDDPASNNALEYEHEDQAFDEVEFAE